MEPKPKKMDTFLWVLTTLAVLGTVAGTVVTKASELELELPVAAAAGLAIFAFLGRVAIRTLRTPSTKEGLVSGLLLFLSIFTLSTGDIEWPKGGAPVEPVAPEGEIYPLDAAPDPMVYTDSDEPGDTSDIE